MPTAAVSLDDLSFAETRHLRIHSNAAQRHVRVRAVFIPRAHQLPSTGEVDALDACQRAFALKRRLRLRADDLLILVTSANISDHDGDEYFSVSNLDYPAIKTRYPGVGILSLYYLNKRSTFFKRAQQRREWTRLPARHRKRVLSDSILLNLLCALSTQLTGLNTHDATHECIMDFCDEPFEIRRALRGGFSYCAPCMRRLARSAGGRALVAIAQRLTARPFHAQPPKIFISYSRRNSKQAQRLWADLTDRGHEVFLDRASIKGGAAWEKEIKWQLQRTDFVILCLSASALTPRAVSRRGDFRYELETAIRLSRSKRAGFVIPVRLHPFTKGIPAELKRFNYVDMYPKWDLGVDGISSSIAGYQVRDF